MRPIIFTMLIFLSSCTCTVWNRKDVYRDAFEGCMSRLPVGTEKTLEKILAAADCREYAITTTRDYINSCGAN